MKWRMQKWSVNHKNKMLFCNSSKPNFNATTSNKLIWYPKQKPKNWCFCIVVQGKTLESPLDSKDIKPVNPKRKSILNIHWKDWCWNWSPNTLATWWEEVTHWKSPWCWGRLRTGGEGDNRVWDGWMASPTQWTWVWASSGSWWWTGEAWCAIVHGVAKSWTWLSNWADWTDWHWNRLRHIIPSSQYIPKLGEKKF